MHPSRRVDSLLGVLGFVPVSLHNQIPARAELSWNSRRYNMPVRVNDLHFDVWVNSPDGAYSPLDWIIDRTLEADRACLSHPVADRDLRHVHVANNTFHDLDRAWRAGHDPGAQRAQIEFRKARVIKLANEHGRYAVETCATLRCHGLEHTHRIKGLRRIDHCGPVGDAGKIAKDHPETMIKRNR